MKVCRFAMLVLAAMILLGTCGAAAEFKNGMAFALGNVPKELVVERRAGEPVRFSLEENPTTGFTWEVESNTNECEVALERRGRGGNPRPAFLRLAKEMGAKFLFGINNFDPGPKALSKWLEAIVWLDLGPSDIWTPQPVFPRYMVI